MEDILSMFLDELSSSLKNKKLSPEQLKLVGEFYMLYNFNENIDSEEKKMKKYLATGWYIYNIIYPTLQNNTPS